MDMAWLKWYIKYYFRLAPAAGGIKPTTKEAPAASGTAIAASEPRYTTLTCSFPVTTTVNMLIPLIPSLPCLPLFPFNLLWFVSDCVDVCVDVWVNICVDVCIDVCIDVCVEGCVDVCVNVHVNVCVDVRVNVRVDVCVDVCVDVWVNILVSRLDVLWWKRKKQQCHRCFIVVPSLFHRCSVVVSLFVPSLFHLTPLLLVHFL
jgi:hypothetical protein